MGKPQEKSVFIAMYEEYSGKGDTLEEAFSELTDFCSDARIDDSSFFEATQIKVEQKIVKVPVPVQVG